MINLVRGGFVNAIYDLQFLFLLKKFLKKIFICLLLLPSQFLNVYWLEILGLVPSCGQICFINRMSSFSFFFYFGISSLMSYPYIPFYNFRYFGYSIWRYA